MIKKTVVLLIVLLLGTFILSPTRKDTFYTIHFETQGGSSIPSYEGTLERFFNTPIPFKEGFIFEGWFLDEDFEYAFDQAFIEDELVLYAKWKAIPFNALVFHMSHIQLENGIFESSLFINGDVLVHAYDIEILYDASVELLSYENPMAQIVNANLDYRIRFNYINLEQGINQPTAILKVVTKSNLDINNAFTINVKDVYSYHEQIIQSVEYTTE